MTFLELCQRLRQEVGAAGNGPANVAGQSGEYARLISWVQTAWREIQLERRWRFDWAQGAVELNADDTTYPLPADFDTWAPDTLRFAGRAVSIIGWEAMRNTGNDHLCCAAVAPNGVLHLNAAPETGGVLTFEYWRAPQELTGNSDTPRLPERYHMAIVYRAMIQYALYENAAEVLQQAQMNYQQMTMRISVTELPPMELGEPLA